VLEPGQDRPTVPRRNDVFLIEPQPEPRRWTSAELETLRTLYKEHGSIAAAVALGRTRQAVLRKANKLGLRVRPFWTPREDARLRFLWDTSASLSAIGKEIGRSPTGVYCRAQILGLPLGVPQGYEFISAASERTGYWVQTLEKILAWAGVRAHAVRTLGTRRGEVRRYVDPLDVDDAIALWHKTESLHAAAQRHGVSDATLRRWLRRIGVEEPERGSKQMWRVLSVDADRAMAARERSR
jgi:hypothetical protein